MRFSLLLGEHALLAPASNGPAKGFDEVPSVGVDWARLSA